MPLGRRVSKDVMDRYAADEELAGTYRDRLAAAAEAERALRAAELAEGTTGPRVRELAVELDKALFEVLLAAEAAERVAAGPKTYVPENAKDADKAAIDASIAWRKAKAKDAVRPWTDEVDRLRTAREAHRLSYRAGSAVPV